MFNDKFLLTQAVLEGRKTQTRRTITYPKTFHGKDVCGYYVCRRAEDGAITEVCMYDENESFIDEGQILPKYKVGEVVAVAQSYETISNAISKTESKEKAVFYCKVMKACFPDAIIHKDKEEIAGWDNKMFVRADLMPHQIRITDVRVERLQDISDECCLKEGVVKDTCKTYFNGYTVKFSLDQYNNMLSSEWFKTPREAFANLIDKVGGKGTWDSNPYVWVYDFKLIK